MTDRSILKNLGNALRGGLKGSRPGTQPLTTIEHRCPQCQNALDPSWTQCPYCEASKKAGDRTSRPAPDAAPPAAGRRATRLEAEGSAAADAMAPSAASPAAAPAAPAPARGFTQVDTGPAGPASSARAGGGGRRLTGIVTTFTWSRLGELFKIHDGRNYAGSGDVAAENNRRCDIHVAQDHLLSGAHFLILCQSNGRYVISDNLSTNGTFVNDEQIDSRGTELPDNAVIKAGATVFVFQKILRAPQTGASAEPPADAPRAGREGDGREDTVM